MMTIRGFQKAILGWFDQHGRKQLPWQFHKNHYRVWVSEIMLQQTQVSTVIPYFERFIGRFPTIQALAAAPSDEVLSYWSGLGYYARARNLHRAAGIVVEQYQGHFPTELTVAMQLPGLGRSTASAILALVDQKPLPILDGNVKRVLSRFAAVPGWGGDPKVTEPLWQLAEQYMPTTRVDDYTQAMMDLGALICTRTKPKCLLCPLKTGCQAYQLGEVDRYPSAKPIKVKPEKHCYFICLVNQQQQVFLMPRPQSGIWGGLWAFPMVETFRAVEQWLAQHLEKAEYELTVWAEQYHIFTHFKLCYIPVIITVSKIEQRALPEGQWLNVAALQQVGIPAPIAKLIPAVLSNSALLSNKN